MIEPKDIRWEELTFSFTATRSMYMAHCSGKGPWSPGALQPFGNIPLSPAATVLNYGQGIFEGLKAYSTRDKRHVLFRPEENAARIAEGCRRLCIPPLPEETFLSGVHQIVKDNADFIPPYRPNSPFQGALYIRPLIFGSGPGLGVAPSLEYTFLIFVSPVGPYFKSGFKPITLRMAKTYHRAAPGGTGSIKAIGNYACGMMPGKMAKEEGFSEMLYLDAVENKYVEEVGAANFFCLCRGILLTPSLDGTILPGVTRKSVIHLAKDRLGLSVEERKVSWEEALHAEEAFGAGTAAVISPVGSIHYEDREYVMGNGQVGPITRKLYELLIGIQQGLVPDGYGWIKEV